MASGQQEHVKGKDIQVKNEADGIGLIVFKEEKCESCPPATSQNPREDESLWMVSPQLFSTSDESETKSDESNPRVWNGRPNIRARSCVFTPPVSGAQPCWKTEKSILLN
jgi:hypothetical protein